MTIMQRSPANVATQSWDKCIRVVMPGYFWFACSVANFHLYFFGENCKSSNSVLEKVFKNQLNFYFIELRFKAQSNKQSCEHFLQEESLDREEFLFEQNWPKLASFRFWSSILLSWLILPFVFLEITSASCLGIRVKLLPNTRQKADINYVIGYYRPCLRDNEEEFSPKARLDFDRQ